MSALPPPSMNRDPLAKSAPDISAATNRGILGRVGAAVGVDHHDDVAGCGGKTARQCVALAFSSLSDMDAVWPQLECHLRCPIPMIAVHEDDLVDARRHPGCDEREIAFFVERRNNDGDLRP